AGNGPEHTGADRSVLVVQQDRRIVVELDQRTVLATYAALGAHDQRLQHLAFLDLAARNGFLNGDLDHVADPGVTAMRAAQHLDAHDTTRAAVVCHFQIRLYLYHGSYSFPGRRRATTSSSFLKLGGSFVDAHQRPGLGLRNRAHLLHGDGLSFLAGVLLVVRGDLGRTGHVLAVHRVLFATLDEHGDGLVHLVADNPDSNGTGGLLRVGFHVFHFLYTARLFASCHNQ